MAMENDVARIRAALNTPGLKYRSFGNQPVRGEPEPLGGSGGEAPPVYASPVPVDEERIMAPAPDAVEAASQAADAQRIDWAALATMAAEPEAEPARPAPATAEPARLAVAPQAAPQPVPAATMPAQPQPLPTPTSQLLNLGPAVDPAPRPARRTAPDGPDIAYALLDSLSQNAPAPAASPVAPAGGGTLALLRGVSAAEGRPVPAPPPVAAEPKAPAPGSPATEGPAPVALAPVPRPATEVPMPLAEIMQMIASGIAAANAGRTAAHPPSDS
jgi:hypothetical protein